MGTHKQIKETNEYTKCKPRLNTQKNTLSPKGLYELVLVAVYMENFQCTALMPGTTTSTALPSFSHDHHHETDATKRKGGQSN